MMPASPSPAAVAAGWDCHVHVFDAKAPLRPGHYQPAHRPLADIETLAASQGLGHLVLVQPSVYGHDNRVMLAALVAGGGRHRGVAVVKASVSDAELDALHAAGVRGIRFNLVSPAGQRGDPLPDLLALAPRLQARGWHVQCYVQAQQLPQVQAWQAQTGLRFVLDHLAGISVALPADDRAWRALHQLALAGAWIKLSGWYRLGAAAPYDALHDTVRRVAALFGPRLVWGSDWPHTCFDDRHLPAYASTLDPVRTALGETPLFALLNDGARSLYL